MSEDIENFKCPPSSQTDVITVEQPMLSDSNKYQSVKIPDRKSVQGEQTVRISPQMQKQAPTLPTDDMFYEIEYDSVPVPGVGKFVLKPQPQKIQNSVDPEDKDEIRDLFIKMREIARNHRSTYNYSRFFDRRVQNDNAVIFYQQGQMMKDFTDDYSGKVQFSQYFPYYQMMGYEQLRTYFTWRTQIRQGIVTDTSLSYAFLYIYELLSNIGVTNPQDGLDKLMFFWKEFSRFNKAIDKYIIRWLKDYHIFYELPHSFKEFTEQNDLTGYYPKLTETADNFDLYCSISKYNIKKSAFFSDETSKLITDCFTYVMDRIRQDFESAGINFDDALFRPTRKLIVWKPFKDALFYNPQKQPNKQIVFSQNEIYMCKNNEWSFSTVITTEKGKQFIGYVMKKMETVLRKLKKYKYKLTALTDMVNEDTIRILTKSGLFIDKIVTDAVMEFHKEATKIVVTVDNDALARIRKEALVTQESLIVEEQNKSEEAPVSVEFTGENQNIFADAVADNDKEPEQVSDVWQNLCDILTDNELMALTIIFKGGDIKAFADECGEMLEVLIDRINEKAMDYIGDNLMDEEFILYDDYKESVGRMLSLERN